ncbi:hypothetical protein [Marinilabilia salmonicolor]|uniref:Annexin n=1 Tax=Marinilabilia salmonicolor TaxID=989 RepID=A0A368UJL0_9BACT|nr:hypothetical protein [Marinilabilia salmonicolor]RCW28779.1 hypothetical protein DFO77_13616 [Marinilabilia salmonicolor]
MTGLVNKAAMIGIGIKIGVPVLAIGTGIYLIKRMFKRNPDGTSTRVAPSLKDTVIQKENLTISPSDAALFANTLYGAMLDFGTDEKTIYNIIRKISTKDDMLLVIKAFGMKQYLWGTRTALIGQNYNLLGWLRFELSDREIAKIKAKFDQWGIPI